MKIALLAFILALPSCNVLSSDDCPTKLNLCERKLEVCKAKVADPTDPIWLGDVPVFSGEQSGDSAPQ